MSLGLPEQILESVQFDLRQFENQLKMVLHLVLDKEVTRYPIIIAHREAEMVLGRPLIPLDTDKAQWAFNISHLEEFANRRLIMANKVGDFIKNYKDPRQFICVFIVSGQKDGGFAFYPFHE